MRFQDEGNDAELQAGVDEISELAACEGGDRRLGWSHRQPELYHSYPSTLRARQKLHFLS